MKITLQIKEIAEKRGITNAYRLQKVAGLSPSNASKLFSNKSTHISLSTLGKLCDVLNCSPSDLLAYKGDSSDR